MHNGDMWGWADGEDGVVSRVVRVVVAVLAILVIGIGLALYATPSHADGAVFDPAITPAQMLVCDAPVDRADGTPLAIDEIARIEFVRSRDGRVWEAVGSDTHCRLALDLAGLPDGQYYYAATAVDTDGRASARSDAVPFVLRRLQAPSAPTNLRLEAPPA